MTKINLPVILSFALLAFFVVSKAALAQTLSPAPTNSFKAYNITFPIESLGNCSDLASCKAYCDDSTHLDTCVAFAKSKGFYKDQTNDSSILLAAEQELGCNSADSCKAFCQQNTNYDKCSTFAREHKLKGGTDANLSTNATLEKAKGVLGCDSIDTCKAFCSQAANQQKCTDFAKQVGLKGGVSQKGPGGCTSESSCHTFCAANPTACSEFAKNQSTSIYPSISPVYSPYPLRKPLLYPSAYPSIYPRPSYYPGQYPSIYPSSYPRYSGQLPTYTHSTYSYPTITAIPPTSSNTAYPQNASVKGANTHQGQSFFPNTSSFSFRHIEICPAHGSI